jgi:hypothetical protein
MAVIELLGQFLLGNPLVLSYFGRATTAIARRAVETYNLHVLGILGLLGHGVGLLAARRTAPSLINPSSLQVSININHRIIE